MNGQTLPRVKLESGGSFVEIAHCGAELKRWVVGGADWLHGGDPVWWEKSAPLLFPTVGKSRNDQVRIDGKTYPMGMHGFAARQPFELISTSANEALFRLSDNEETRRSFPFSFQLDVQYRLSERSISLDARIVNRGDLAMPVAFGTHPAFVWPLPGAEGQPHKVQFDEDVSNQVPLITPDGLFCADNRAVAMAGRDLWLGEGECFTGRALCFLDYGKVGVRFGPENGPSLRARGHGFRHMALWTKPRAPFLSIEHWTDHGENENETWDLPNRPDAITLAPGEAVEAGTVYDIEA